MKRSKQKALWTAIAALLGASFALRAQQPTGPTGDDPTRGVARISIVQGVVNVKRGDSGEVVAAAQNAPLMTQDHLETADGSRSEIQFDAGNLVRLAPNTELALADVERGRYQMQLATGTIIFRVIRDYRADVEIDTPSVAIRPRGVGVYRVSVYGDGTTAVTVRAGETAVYSPRGSQSLSARQTMLVRGPSSDPEFQVQNELPPDQFDDWSNNRDSQMLASRSPQYVSPDIYGTEDLDPYGSWVPSTYGNVWAPQVSPGWAPYQNGRWVWEDYYGWTWLDYDPWGWAPFHYGRWFWNGGYGWCWWPGAIRQAVSWAPALVGFFGFGGLGLNVGLGFANLAWIALAPFELFHPWYGPGWFGHPGWGGFYNHAFVNNANIYNAFRNARINNAIAYTGINNFGRESQAFYRANGSQIRNASLVQGQVPVAPGRSSLAFSNRSPIGASTRFGASQSQHFFTHQQPSQAQRTPFARQQQQMGQFQERMLGVKPNFSNEQSRAGGAAQGFRPFSGSSGNGYGAMPRASSPANSVSRQTPSDSGWHRFGDPGASSYVRPNERSFQGRGGWGSFGSPGGVGAPRGQGSSGYQNGFGGGQRYSQPQGSRFAQPMRINPPIVQRPSYSAPRSNAPRYSTPHYNAPSGGGHSSGGHSGGGHSSGGHSGGGGGHSGGGHSGGGGHHR
jgi:hypothetical protein